MKKTNITNMKKNIDIPDGIRWDLDKIINLKYIKL